MSVDESGRHLVVASPDRISVYDTSTGLASRTLNLTPDEVVRRSIFINAAMCGDDKLLVIIWSNDHKTGERVIVYNVPTAGHGKIVRSNSF